MMSFFTKPAISTAEEKADIVTSGGNSNDGSNKATENHFVHNETTLDLDGSKEAKKQDNQKPEKKPKAEMDTKDEQTKDEKKPDGKKVQKDTSSGNKPEGTFSFGEERSSPLGIKTTHRADAGGSFDGIPLHDGNAASVGFQGTTKEGEHDPNGTGLDALTQENDILEEKDKGTHKGKKSVPSGARSDGPILVKDDGDGPAKIMTRDGPKADLEIPSRGLLLSRQAVEGEVSGLMNDDDTLAKEKEMEKKKGISGALFGRDKIMMESLAAVGARSNNNNHNDNTVEKENSSKTRRDGPKVSLGSPDVPGVLSSRQTTSSFGCSADEGDDMFLKKEEMEKKRATTTAIQKQVDAASRSNVIEKEDCSPETRRNGGTGPRASLLEETAPKICHRAADGDDSGLTDGNLFQKRAETEGKKKGIVLDDVTMPHREKCKNENNEPIIADQHDQEQRAQREEVDSFAAFPTMDVGKAKSVAGAKTSASDHSEHDLGVFLQDCSPESVASGNDNNQEHHAQSLLTTSVSMGATQAPSHDHIDEAQQPQQQDDQSLSSEAEFARFRAGAWFVNDAGEGLPVVRRLDRWRPDSSVVSMLSAGSDRRGINDPENAVSVVGDGADDDGAPTTTPLNAIAVAEVVERSPEYQRLQQQRVEIEHDIKNRKRKIRREMAMLVLFGAVLAAVLGGTLGTQLDRDKNVEAQPTSPPSRIEPTSTPTLTRRPSMSLSPSWNPSRSPSPSAPPSSALEASLVARIQSAKPTISFADPRTIQSRALEWLVQDQYTMETPLTNASLVQRFALVSLAFATNFESWDLSVNWLVPVDECRWFQVGCNQTTSEVDTIALAGVGLSGSLPPEIGLLTKLRQLNLYLNDISGVLPTEMGELTGLTLLSLRNNSLVGSIVTELSRLTLLEGLYLNFNELSGSIPTFMGSLSRLTDLRLDGNALTGSVPAQVLRHTTDLTALDISRNQLSAVFPTELGLLSKLTFLVMFENTFRGHIPTTLGYLQSLVLLDFSSNSISGTVPTELGLLTGLTDLQMHTNALRGHIPTTLGHLQKLKRLDISLNTISGAVPTELGLLSQLTFLQMLENNLRGPIPTAIGRLQKLELLDISFNSISGMVPTELGLLTSSTWLQMLGNNLRGRIPTIIGHLQELERLDISSNALSGAVPTELGLLTRLTWLQLLGNNLRGRIPTILGHLQQLEDLDFSMNILSGVVPTELGLLTKLTWLQMDINAFTGRIPTFIGRLRDLERLGFSDNALSDVVPTELGLLSRLAQLNMRANAFKGRIPTFIGRLEELERFDFSSNALSGAMPTELGLLTRLTFLNLNRNNLGGWIPSELGHTTGLTALALGANRLSGTFPSELGRLVQLSALVLPVNRLEGPVPKQIALLTNLNLLQLFENKLSGSIPLSLCSFVTPVIDCGEIICKCCRGENNRNCV